MATLPTSVAAALKTEIEAMIDRALSRQSVESRTVSFSNTNKTVTLSLSVEITDTLT